MAHHCVFICYSSYYVENLFMLIVHSHKLFADTSVKFFLTFYCIVLLLSFESLLYTLDTDCHWIHDFLIFLLSFHSLNNILDRSLFLLRPTYPFFKKWIWCFSIISNKIVVWPAVCTKSLQLCSTLWSPVDDSPPDSLCP